MATFHLHIGTPDGLMFEGNVERVLCRTITGDLAILAGHCNFCTAIGMGEGAVVLEDGTRRRAACIGGMLSVMDGACNLMATTWEWVEEIDVERAKESRIRAEQVLADPQATEQDKVLATARLHRALVRLGVAGA